MDLPPAKTAAEGLLEAPDGTAEDPTRTPGLAPAAGTHLETPKQLAAKVAQLQLENTALREELTHLTGSLAWKVIRKYWAAREALLPPNTLRGDVYQSLKRSANELLGTTAAGPRRWLTTLAGSAVGRSRGPSDDAEPSLPWSRPLTEVSRGTLGRRILIVAELSIPQCKRYRVDQKVEMLQSLGYETTVISWQHEQPCLTALQLHGLVIFYRVPAFDGVKRLMAEAKRLGVPSFFDIDDLVFDDVEYRKNRNLQRLPKPEQEELLRGARLYREALGLCDGAIASTSAIAARMRDANSGPIHVVENGLDERTLQLAAELERRPPARAPGEVVIGYGSGTRTHDADFAVAAEALAAVLGRYPQVRLVIHGHLELPGVLEPFSDRIYRIPFLESDDYLRAVASWDISIAPLEDSAFNDAKSNIKYIEASLFGVPTVCSPAEAFRSVIENGKTGMLASGTGDWLQALARLVEDAGERARMGAAAREAVMARYRPEAIATRQLSAVLSALGQPRREKLRVLEVNTLFAPFSFGGATLVAEQMAQGLNETGCEAVVFTGIWESPLRPYSIVRYETNGLPVIGVQLPDVGTRALEHDNPQMRHLFADVLKAVQPDVVHFHSVQKLGASLTEACAEAGVPYVITLHDAWWLCERQFMVREDGVYCGQSAVDLRVCAACVPEPAFTAKRTFALRKALDGAAFLLAPSEFQRQLYIANGVRPEAIRVNKNGVALPGQPRRPRPPEAPVRLAYVGGRAAHKGYDWLRSIVAEIPESNYVLRLVDVQQRLGTASISLDEWKASGHVEVVAPYDRQTIDAFFDEVDVLLFPSQVKESFGLTVREALIRDVWVITTDAGGASEAIVEGVNGDRVPMADRAGFKGAIQRVLQSPGRLAAYRNPLRSQVRPVAEQASELHALLREGASGASLRPLDTPGK